MRRRITRKEEDEEREQADPIMIMKPRLEMERHFERSAHLVSLIVLLVVVVVYINMKI